jgi:hypothetical protein
VGIGDLMPASDLIGGEHVPKVGIHPTAGVIQSSQSWRDRCYLQEPAPFHIVLLCCRIGSGWFQGNYRIVVGQAEPVGGGAVPQA